MHHRGVRSIAPLSALIAAAACSLSDVGITGSECVAPKLISESVAPNPANVISAIIAVRSTDADSLVVRYGVGGSLESSTPSFAFRGDSLVVPILGLYPDGDYKVQVTAFNHCARINGTVFSFTTGSLPSDLPSYSAGGSAPDSGYVVFAAGNYGLAIDNSGRVVWYHRFKNGPGLNFQAQLNGRYVARPNPEAGKAPVWIEIGPAGDTTRTLTCAGGLAPRMHDMIAAADGSYWLLCDETRVVDLSAQGRSSESRVLASGVQWRDANGNLLFSWSPFDHIPIDLSILDVQDANSNPINWTHANAIDLDIDDYVLVSFRNLSQVVKIAPFTGQMIWRMGGKGSEFTFENSAMPPFTRQHGVRAVGLNQVELLDNLGESGSSRAERYELNPSTHTARLIGSYTPSSSLVAQIGGSTQALTSGHVLVSFGNGGGVEEYDSSGNLVWKMYGNPGYVFRAQRIHSLYFPGARDPR